MDVPRDWIELIDMDMLATIDESIDEPGICPPKHMWFNWAKVPPKDVKIIIVGMDPYPNLRNAHGLAFSSPDKKIPASLANIYSCLIESGLLAKRPKTADLTNWCKQGILLINAAFSTIDGMSGKHLKIWKPFTQNLLDNLFKYGAKHNRTYIIMAWGRDSQALFSMSSVKKHKLLTWAHPSPQAQGSLDETKKFVNCDHFKIASKAYDIVWDPEWDPDCGLSEEEEPVKHVIFTDGSCTKNGNSSAVGGYGIVFADGPFKGGQEFGRLPASEYNDTNIRAEGFAILKAMARLKKYPDWDECIIYTDSEFWIKMIYEYMPAWEPHKFDEKENSDLTKAIWKLWKKLDSCRKIQIKWVPGHDGLEWSKSDDAHKKRCSKYNAIADRLAEMGREC